MGASNAMREIANRLAKFLGHMARSTTVLLAKILGHALSQLFWALIAAVMLLWIQTAFHHTHAYPGTNSSRAAPQSQRPS